MSRPIPWQRTAHARRKLWYLVMDRFATGRYSVTLTRDELLEAGVIGHDFDDAGRPAVRSDSEMLVSQEPPLIGEAEKEVGR